MTSNQICMTTLAALAFAGCAAGADGDSTDGDPKSGDVSPDTAAAAGYYYVDGGVQSALWIQDMNLHGDGTYEADFGNGVSNLSGHEYADDGTFTVDSKAGTISFTSSFGGSSTAVYTLKKVSGGLQLEVKDGGSENAAFTMTKGSKPATLSFAAGAHGVLTGDLVPGQQALVTYAAARSNCGVGASTTSSPVTMLAAPDHEFGVQTVVSLPPRAADGTYRALFTVPDGQSTLSVWFEQNTIDASGNVTCTQWDSVNGENYNFPLTPAS